jgi:serine/tyrosine/threonine adenylyltransferase
MIRFAEPTYARLPEAFHTRLDPTAVRNPAWIMRNDALAIELGIDPAKLASDTGLAIMAGNQVPAGATPLAMAYAGHQFGNWVPLLGDGRALLLGEIIDQAGRPRELQLKGSGPTPYSRGGDGRASIGPVVREYLGSEAMAALGIASTRALAAVATGESVQRERQEPGGILCRVARSHVRIGTFEYIAARQDPALLKALVGHVIQSHYPRLIDHPRPAQGLLEAVIQDTAKLVSAWMQVGFIHGVMNTDNCSIVAETIDFGPFGFMEAFDPATAYSYIDRHRRYAWNQQPSIAQWNLARLAEALLPLLADTEAQALEIANASIAGFGPAFEAHFHTGLAGKIGLTEPTDDDAELAFELLRLMQANGADMTLTFRGLGSLYAADASQDGPVRQLFSEPAAFDAWARQWRQRLAGQHREEASRKAAMNAVNPAFILRNHLAQQAVDAAIERLDFAPMHRLNRVLAKPYEDQPDQADLARPAKPGQQVNTTFCGT